MNGWNGEYSESAGLVLMCAPSARKKNLWDCGVAIILYQHVEILATMYRRWQS